MAHVETKKNESFGLRISLSWKKFPDNQSQNKSLMYEISVWGNEKYWKSW